MSQFRSEAGISALWSPSHASASFRMEEMAKADVAKYMTPEQARKILGMEP